MAARMFNERSGLEVMARFRKVNGTPVIPGSVHWRLRCATNNQTLQDWTETTYQVATTDDGELESVTSSVDVPASLNTILDRGNRREVKELQIVSDKDTEREYSKLLQYYVAQMSGGRS